jgi:hypothetical protein
MVVAAVVVVVVVGAVHSSNDESISQNMGLHIPQIKQNITLHITLHSTLHITLQITLQITQRNSRGEIKPSPKIYRGKEKFPKFRRKNVSYSG